MTVLEFRSGQAPDKIELLQGLQPQEIDLILAAGRLRRFSPKSVMTRQGNSADHLLLLWRGRARYFFETQNGKKLNLRPITPGHVFGGAALVSGHSSYLVSTEAMQDSVVACMGTSNHSRLGKTLQAAPGECTPRGFRPF